ncbi:MAG TPA: glycerol kinase GlpK [Acidimicrobiales bacterium]|nr:glycerol kinase GlpK [Acidimicrobiales bacterium]
MSPAVAISGPFVIAVDAGTTGVRSLVVDAGGAVVDVAYRELTQHFPRPGWVEHDAAEIRGHVLDTLAEVAGRLSARGGSAAAIGITNQRETVVAWDRRSGEPLARALVWQDRRTAGRCEELEAAGHLDTVRRRTGLVLDPYFSATKMAWLLERGGVPDTGDLALGTVDAWVAWILTGGPDGGVLATDATNASRTLLYDIVDHRWSQELAELFGVPLHALPEVRPSCGRIGVLAGEAAAASGLAGVPVSGVAGDQQAALFGQACFEPGMAKVTYGTGSFALLNVGPVCPEPAEGLLTTVAWDLGAHGGPEPFAYALEGAVFVTGAAIQWLRDGLGIITEAAEVGPLAEQVADSEGVVVVPAFTGLGSPWWDPYARGTIVGLSRGLGAAHIARATVESIAFSVRDAVDAMTAATGTRLSVIRADGGAAVLELLLQLQADQLQVPVTRPVSTETTALGAATLAGLAEGVWSSTGELAGLWRADVERAPARSPIAADAAHDRWLRAVERSRHWARDVRA